ncbi:hypothetical protein P0D73_19810 [Paraburkholderia sp. RL18-101-BIB-B]|uniref:hypothetical protein n=1 Tax=Paraburkholderia sp. RL18-101-BIB-B TaxID=3031634 RepID=UPI0038B93722
MSRDRSRTAVESYLLELLLKAGSGTLDGRLLSAKSFAEQAGLSRQALYKGHADVVAALKFMSRIARSTAPDSPQTEQLVRAKEEVEALQRQLDGATKQNSELGVQIYELQEQLKRRGLTPVPRTQSW